jgi:hypothetical protein|tara:strand:+ start:114 stop:758 length:645 start_codon:yes stop_codon:yes gene_type:complete
MKLICEINEDLEYVAEEADGGKNHFIKGVFMQGNIKNRNGRIYPMEVLQKEVARYNADYIDRKRSLGELGHPAGPTINLDRVSHMITELYQEGDNFMGKAKILDTPMGNIVKNLMNEGATIGVSSRGMGSLKQRNGVAEVQNDFYLATAADIVADPSAPDAFVEGIMEGKEWIWDNGIIREATINDYKNEIQEASPQDITESMIRVYKDFISKL